MQHALNRSYRPGGGASNLLVLEQTADGRAFAEETQLAVQVASRKLEHMRLMVEAGPKLTSAAAVLDECNALVEAESKDEARIVWESRLEPFVRMIMDVRFRPLPKVQAFLRRYEADRSRLFPNSRRWDLSRFVSKTVPNVEVDVQLVAAQSVLNRVQGMIKSNKRGDAKTAVAADLGRNVLKLVQLSEQAGAADEASGLADPRVAKLVERYEALRQELFAQEIREAERVEAARQAAWEAAEAERLARMPVEFAPGNMTLSKHIALYLAENRPPMVLRPRPDAEDVQWNPSVKLEGD